MVGEINTGFLVKVTDKFSEPLNKMEKAIGKVKNEAKDYSIILNNQAKIEAILSKKFKKRTSDIYHGLSTKYKAQFLEQTGILEQIAAEKALNNVRAKEDIASKLRTGIREKNIGQNEKLTEVIARGRAEQEMLYAASMKDAAILSKLGAGTIALGIASVMANEKIHSMKLSLEAATGSAKDAKEIFSRLQKLSEITPLPTAQIVDTDAALIELTGSQKKSEKIIKQLAIVSGAYKLNLSSVAQTYMRINEQHRLGRYELRSLGRAYAPMIAAMKEITKQNGISADTFNRFMLAGRLSSDLYVAALKRITDKGGAAYNMLQKRNETFMANLAEFKNISAVYLNDLWKMISGTNTLGESFKNLNDVLKRLEPTTSHVGEIRKTVTQLASPVGTVGGIFSMIEKIIQSTRAYEAGKPQHVTIHVDDPKGYVKHVSSSSGTNVSSNVNVGINMPHAIR